LPSGGRSWDPTEPKLTSTAHRTASTTELSSTEQGVDLEEVWRIGRRLGVLVILFVAWGLTLADTSGWAALSVNRGRQELIRAHVPFNPLFPSGPLPATLDTAKSRLTRRGPLYEVTWTDCCGSDGALTTIVGFGRERTSALHRYIKFARQRLNPVRTIQVGTHRGIFIRGDITYFLYVPIGRFAYYVSNHSALDNTLTNREMVNMLASATNLGNEWVGQTTQGHVIDLYRTTTGLDYYVEWHTNCEASGDRLYTFADPLIPVVADAFDDSGPYTIDTGEQASITLAGSFSGRTASGVLQGQYDDSSGGLCQSGPMTWSANQIGV
jgi:hypothetical protein